MFSPVLSGATVLLLLLLSTVASSLASPDDFELGEDEENEKTYGVIVDCGSSGTRAHIFEWKSELEYPALLNDIEPMRDENGKPITKRITPGLSSLDDDPTKASEYMQPIINFITQYIPPESHRSTGVYILGTAGMRLLDEKTQLTIMNDIAVDVRAKHSFAKVKTSVISGATEGMYQWITVNSKSKRFINTKDSKVRAQPYGMIEIGGASIQITYQLRPGMESYLRDLLANNPEAQRALRSARVVPRISREAEEYNYKLVSTTFLGLGGNSAREAYVDLLVMRMRRLSSQQSRSQGKTATSYSTGKPLVLKDPCLPRGGQETVVRPTRMFETSRQTIGYTVDDDDEIFNVILIGTGNYGHCVKNMREMLITAKNEKMNCEPGKACPMTLLGTPFVPFFSYEFLGLSDLYYTTNEMLNMAGKYDREKVAKKTTDICETPYVKLTVQYPEANRNDKTRVLRECFKAVWIDTFLREGLKMPAEYDSFTTIGYIESAQGYKDPLEWTLGAVLDKSLTIELAAETVG